MDGIRYHSSSSGGYRLDDDYSHIDPICSRGARLSGRQLHDLQAAAERRARDSHLQVLAPSRRDVRVSPFAPPPLGSASRSRSSAPAFRQREEPSAGQYVAGAIRAAKAVVDVWDAYHEADDTTAQYKLARGATAGLTAIKNVGLQTSTTADLLVATTAAAATYEAKQRRDLGRAGAYSAAAAMTASAMLNAGKERGLSDEEMRPLRRMHTAARATALTEKFADGSAHGAYEHAHSVMEGLGASSNVTSTVKTISGVGGVYSKYKKNNGDITTVLPALASAVEGADELYRISRSKRDDRDPGGYTERSDGAVREPRPLRRRGRLSTAETGGFVEEPIFRGRASASHSKGVERSSYSSRPQEPADDRAARSRRNLSAAPTDRHRWDSSRPRW